VPGRLARLYHVDRQRGTARYQSLAAIRPLEELSRALTDMVWASRITLIILGKER